MMIINVFVDMVWGGLGCGSVVDCRLTGSFFVRNPCSFRCRLATSSSSCRTSVLSSSRVDGTWFTFNSDPSCSLACRLLRFFFDWSDGGNINSDISKMSFS